MPVESIDDLEDGETYHYVPEGEPVERRKYTFTVELDYMDVDDFAGYGEGAIQLQYRDGYVADVPVSNIERQINDGQIAEGEL